MPVSGIPLYVGIPITIFIYKAEGNHIFTWASHVPVFAKVEFERNMVTLSNFVYISGENGM